MPRRIVIQQSVMAADEKIAARIRKDLSQRGVLMLNLIGSPGAGKTALLESTLTGAPFRSVVLEGDVATSRDAERIARTGTPVVQINTRGGCHLEAHLVDKALEELELDGIDVVFIENVGNLVCPAEFDLGEDHKVAVCSVPEGPDKPLKYPHLFSQADAVLLTKVDLLEHLDFDRDLFWGDVRDLNSRAQMLEVSALRGEGVPEWIAVVERWIRGKRS
ncbi:MAG: hydrogenase nickel incorporation protein HypB [Thermovirgaceae bacterium]|jgi:hydrogenase nickel incorporation protein HypB|nr:hydrogenase nickel incorporation protein HypB [Synergistales bacterium]MDI9392176.1 hydrogenase nickel incorporation protein HypB [Synergistota bacterium]MDY0179280.1 hydrogenase nickel incorporation protein HypB [Synergistaceae bacterium]HRW87941.1 hydrogenase nickel incorporation protein HypB [Thermovirgaceae bacterium]MDD3133590.1 hydrogenase nickel incorporation protein HypB [Synergistales bacterium]